MPAKTPEFDIRDLTGRNKIINGGMRIDQRRAGAANTPSTLVTYHVDRWRLDVSAFTPAATDFFEILQPIEGSNIVDLSFGSPSAKTITLSFWVYSSITGLHSGALRNSAGNRSYPYSYTISAANTWEYKTITIAGDISGTWLTNNGIGLIAAFSLGAGSNFKGTAGAWSDSTLTSVTGSVNIVETLSATFYITGVQLEIGSVASSFEVLPFPQVLQNCQRYYEKSYDVDTAIGTNTGVGREDTVDRAGSSAATDGITVTCKILKRIAPTASVLTEAGTAGQIAYFGSGTGTGTAIASSAGIRSINVALTGGAGLTVNTAVHLRFHWIADAEL